MDAVKKFMKTLGNYKFWILSALIFIASLVVFIINKIGMDKVIAARTSAVEEAFTKINGINGEASTHPNSHSHQELDKIVNVLKQEVKEAWEIQYARQSKHLYWPEKAFPSNKIALEIFRNLRPIEQYVEFPIDPKAAPVNKITKVDRDVYKNYIGPEFANISKKIGTEWKAKTESITGAAGGGGYGMGLGGMGSSEPGSDSGGYGAGYGSEMGSGMPGGGGYGGTGPGMQDSKDLVRWSRESQQTLMNQVLPWYPRREPPSVLDIYYTQEDMWLLNGLMEIIAATNAGAVENFQTKIREIEWIRMGKHANRDAGTLAIGGSRNMGMGMGMGMGEGGESGMGGGIDYGASMGGSEPESGEGGMGKGDGFGGMSAPAVDPADNRYLSFAPETEFSPVTGQQLRDAIKNINAGNAVDAVARRVPIRMRLKVDPNHISTIIAECGNGNMMLEVYQVRLNTAPASASAIGGGGYGGGMEGGGSKGAMGMGGGGASVGGEEEMGMPGGGYGSEGGFGMEPGSDAGGYGGGGYGGGAYGGAAGGATQLQAMNEVAIEIFGLIYLYNPVNMGPLAETAEAAAEQTLNESSDSKADAPAAGQPASQPATPTQPNSTGMNRMPADRTENLISSAARTNSVPPQTQ